MSSSVEIRYGDIAPGAKEAFEPTCDDIQDFVELEELKMDGLQFKNFSTVGELNQTLLNRSQEILPDSIVIAEENMGLWSNSLADENGIFSMPVLLTLTASNSISSQGFTLTFDNDVNCWCNNLIINWYRDSELINSKEFFPDSAEYFCENQVRTFNKVEMIFKKMNMPYTYLKLRVIDWGIFRLITNDELESTGVIEEISSISAELSINTFDFTLRNKKNVDFMFQSKQPLKLSFKGNLRGLFFINKAIRMAEDRYKIQAQDYIGLLDKISFMGGIYDNKSLVELLDEIFSEAAITYELQAGLENEVLTGYLPISTSREALMQIAFATGTVIDTTNSEKVKIFRLDDTIKKHFTEKEIMQGQNFESLDKLTEFQLVEHQYITTTETTELYKASESGIGNNIYITFSQPIHSLSITNGTIIKSGANYAIINANANCILTGMQYKDVTRIISVKNPLVELGDLQNIQRVDNATLVNANNSQMIAQRCYSYFEKANIINGKIIMNENIIGDKISLETEYLGERIGVVESMRYNLNGNDIVAEVVVR